MRFQRLIFTAILFAACLSLQAGRGENRIWIKAKINGKSAKLAFDTGATVLTLWGTNTAERFGLKVTPPPADFKAPPGQVAIGRTEECSVKIGSVKDRASLAVFYVPSNASDAGFDGIIGWFNIDQNSIVRIDAARHRLKFYDALPKEAAGWIELPVRTNATCLALELPADNGATESVQIDTGDTVGAALSTNRWRAWKQAHADEPSTLHLFVMPGSGWTVREEAWADALDLGAFTLNGVPVTESAPTQSDGFPHFRATLGMAALARLDLIVDRQHNVAYVHPKTTRAPAYDHNRLGAVFAPDDTAGGKLVAKVLPGSPAAVAGVQDGDVLLKINRDDYSSDPPGANGKLYRSAGTKLHLTLDRNGQTTNITAVLHELVAPAKTGR